MSTQTQTQADLMKRVVRKIIEEGLNRGDVGVFDETHSVDCMWHGPGGREIRGLAGIKEMVSGYLSAFPDLKMSIEHEVAEGNLTAIHWRAVGTHDGPLGDAPPTGKRIDIHGHVVSRFERGRVIEEFEVFDEQAMLVQLGLIGT